MPVTIVIPARALPFCIGEPPIPSWTKPISNKTWLQLVSGILVGAACLWISLHNMELSGVAGQLGQVAWPWVAVAVAGVVLVSVGKALRWQWLYPPEAAPVPARTHFSILMISQMLNLIIPVRLGELARLGLMQQEGRAVGMTLGTIVVEKSLDLLAVGSLLLLSVPAAILPEWLRPRVGPSALLTGLALLVVLLLARRLRGPILRLVAAIPAPDRRPWNTLRRYLVKLVQAVLDGIAGVEGRRLAPVLLLTVFVWLMSVAAIQAMLAAFGIGGEWRATLVLMLALTFSNLVPTPPALIGVVGAVTEAVLVPFGVPRVQALTLGTLLNGVMVAPPVLLGGWAAGARLLRMFAPGGRRGSMRQILGLAPLGRSKN